MNNQNDKQNNEKRTYVCESCGSKSKGEAGTCCGAERKPEAVKCEKCGHEHTSDGTCDCGCK